MICHFNIFRKLFVDEHGNRTKYWTRLFNSHDNTPYKQKHKKFIEWIKSQYNDISELFYILQHNITERPKCKVCGNEVMWHNRHYADCCCNSCSAKMRVADQRRKRNKDNVTDILVWDSPIPIERYDNIVLKLFIDKSRRGSHTRMYNRFVNVPKHLHKYYNIRTYIKNRFNDNVFNINKTLWRLNECILEIPKCKVCGSPQKIYRKTSTQYYLNGYCSKSCKMQDGDIQEHIRQLSIERYGSLNNASKISESHKARTDSQVKEAISKRRKTNLEQYGVSDYTNTEQMMKTVNEKYGVNCTQHIPSVHEKTVNTLLDKFGVDHQSKSPVIKDKISKANKIYWSKLSVEERKQYAEKFKKWWASLSETERRNINLKSWATKRKNGTANTSSPEKRCIEYALKKFPNTTSQTISAVYPFHIDIYIKEMDVYIEYQGTWTHGGHPYNPNDHNDVVQAEKWKTKGTDYYTSAYNTWTVMDPHKREIAKQNNLRWYECWTENECYELIDKLYEEYTSEI